MPTAVYPGRATLERLLSSFTIDPVTGCWEYQGSRNKSGYGQIGTIRVHRLSYEIFIGPIPEDKPLVCHRCDNPPCFCPEHLFAGTSADNVLDMLIKGREGARTHPESQPRGEAHGFAKLTADVVTEVRSRLANGEMVISIAEDFGVNPSTVSRIKRGLGWMNDQGQVVEIEQGKSLNLEEVMQPIEALDDYEWEEGWQLRVVTRAHQSAETLLEECVRLREENEELRTRDRRAVLLAVANTLGRFNPYPSKAKAQQEGYWVEKRKAAKHG